MFKKRFKRICAKLVFVFIIMSSVPVYASSEGTVTQNSVPDPALSQNAEKEAGNEEGCKDALSADSVSFQSVSGPALPVEGAVPEVEAAEGEEASAAIDAPYITSVLIYVYKDKNDTNKVTNQYECSTASQYRYTKEEDEQTAFGDKMLLPFEDKGDNAPMVKFVVNSNTDKVEYEYERLDRNDGSVIESSGRTENDYFICSKNSIYRIRVFDKGTENSTMVYLKPAGIDAKKPNDYGSSFLYSGKTVRDSRGRDISGEGNVTIIVKDFESGLPEKPYMYGYPNGQWVSENKLSLKLKGKVPVVIRDKADNYLKLEIDATLLDPDPPETVLEEQTDEKVNGYVSESKIHIIAKDSTALAEDYVSEDNKNWSSYEYIYVTENGRYDVYTKDVFGHVSENSIEISDIDREGPEYTWNIEHSSRAGGFSEKQRLKVNAIDTKSGVSGRAYSFDGKKSWVEDDNIEISENSVIKLCVRDGLGNEGPESVISINDIDNIKPVIDRVLENRINEAGIYAAAAEITVDAKDNESGIGGDYVFFDAKGAWGGDNKLRVSSNGIYSFKVRDRVGNTALSSCKIKNLDPFAPECSITGNPTALTLSKAALKIKAFDEHSGIKSIYMENVKTGHKEPVKKFAANEKGLGANECEAEVTVKENGEYVFYITDMCNNEKKESVTVTKIIKPVVPERKEEENEKEPEKEPEKEKEKEKEKSETVVIGGEKKAGKTVKDIESSITVTDMKISPETEKKKEKEAASENRLSRYNDGDTKMFSDEEKVSENDLTEGYDSEDYSTDIFESDTQDNYSENSPAELEMLPNPDEIEVDEDKGSDTAVIVGTLVAMITLLCALTVFLLVKKGLITLPKFGGQDDTGSLDT